MLIKCRECGKEISDKASKCPNCGVPNPDTPRKMNNWVKVTLVVVLALGIVVVILDLLIGILKAVLLWYF